MNRLSALALVFARKWAIPLIALLVVAALGLGLALWQWTRSSEAQSNALRKAYSQAVTNQAIGPLLQHMEQLSTLNLLLSDSSKTACETAVRQLLEADHALTAGGISWEMEGGREIAVFFREDGQLKSDRQWRPLSEESSLFEMIRQNPMPMIISPYKDKVYQDGSQAERTVTVGHPIFNREAPKKLRAVLQLDLPVDHLLPEDPNQAIVSIDTISQTLFLLSDSVRVFPLDSSRALLRALQVPNEAQQRLQNLLAGTEPFEVSLGGDASLHFQPTSQGLFGLNRWVAVTRIQTGYHPGILFGVATAFVGMLGLALLLFFGIRRYQRQLEAIDEISTAILETSEVRAMVGKVFASLHEKRLMEAPIFVLGIVDPRNPDKLLFPGNFESAPDLPHTQAVQLPPAELDLSDEHLRDRPLLQCFFDHPTLLENNYQSLIPTVIEPTGGQLVPQSYVYVRLTGQGGEKLGVISVQGHQKGAYTTEHLEILQRVGRVAALAIQKTASLEARNQALEDKSKALRNARELRASRDLVFSVLNHEFGNLIYPLNFITWALRNDKPLAPDFANELNLHIQRIMQFNDNIKFWLNSETFGTGEGKSRVPVKDILETVKEIWSFYAMQEKVTIETGEVEDESVWGNALELNLVVSNLVHNAVKFSNPDGRVTLESVKTETGIQIRISDKGIGMQPEEVATLAPEGRVRIRIRPVRKIGPNDRKGSGVGLFVSERLLAQNEGFLTVESEFGVGTTFAVNLGSA